MTNKQLNRYYETLKKMNIESLKSLANNGKIYILTTKEQVADFLLACRIEGINSKGYQCPDISKTELPVFVAVATFEYNVFFILHSHDYRGVWMEVDTVLRNAVEYIAKLEKAKKQMEAALHKHPENDIAYTFPQNMLGYVHEEKPPTVIPYPEDFPVLD